MKLDQLRKVIREEVKTAIKEELQEIMNEAVRAASEPEKQTFYEEVAPMQPNKTTDPIMEMLNQTKATMTSDDYRTVTSATSNMVQKPNFASMMAENMGMKENGVEPGLDISQFDFVKKAGAIYNKSVENDKQKHGI
tara:strand:+ start:1380 stop:1790 length:411 start_codon:yes stop_codon:yes gene_type:complete